jgi:hypothetical protein
MAVISAATLAGHLTRFDGAASSAEKGNAFTDCVQYVITRIPGVSVQHRNALDHAHAQEIDLGLFNGQSRQGLHWLPAIVLVECKGWESPVGAPEVREFATKLRERGQTFGVLASALGITGDPEARTAAQNAIASALQEGISIIVLTRQDIATLSSGAALVTMLKKKLCALAVTRAAV